MANVKYKVISALFLVAIIAITVQSLAVNKGTDVGRKLLNVELPMEQAVREVEVSVWETSNALFYYMLEPSAISLEEYKKQLKDVANYMAKYKALADSEQEKQTVDKFMNIWTDSVAKAEELYKLRNKMTELNEKAWDAVSDADNVINYKIQAAFVDRLPDLVKKEKAVRQVQVSLWKAINSVNYYIHRQFDKPHRQYSPQLENITAFWQKYKSLNITSTEKPFINEFDYKLDTAIKLMNECYSLADELKEKYLAYCESVHTSDDIIDFEVQEYLKARINKMTQ